MKQWISGCLLVLTLICSAASFGQEPLSLPTDPATRDAVAKAAEWLTRHVMTGTLTVDGRESAISVIAWKDPTLAPEIENRLAGKKKSCRQYSFKVATLLYACRLMGLSQEFPADLDLMHRRLIAAQLDSGGLPHFYDVEAEGGAVKSRSEATGEATAIFILAETVNAK